MSPRQLKIATLTRDRTFLIKAATTIGILSVAIAFLTDSIKNKPAKKTIAELSEKTSPPEESGPGDKPPTNPGFPGQFALHGPLSSEKLAAHLRQIATLYRAYGTVTDSPLPDLGTKSLIENSLSDENQKTLFLDFFHAATHSKEASSAELDRIRTQADRNRPPRFANAFLGYLMNVRGDYRTALDAFKKEATLEDAVAAKNSCVELCIDLGAKEELRKLLDTPGFADGLTLRSKKTAATTLRDYGMLFSTSISWWANDLITPWIIIPVISAAIWFTIILQTLGIKKRGAFWGVLAVAAGIASIAVTIFFIFVQEGIVGLKETGDLIDDAIFFTAGVGLREEFCKLLFFLPFIPFLRRANSDALVLAVASWVGLGFAMEENLGYFARSMVAAEPWSRFLTANFFHLAATGLTGYSFYRFIRSPRTRWDEFLGTFLAIVIAHGIYDLVISSSRLEKELSLVAIILLGLLAYAYFGIAAKVRNTAKLIVSPLGVFTLGTALLIGITLNITLFNLPFWSGLGTFGESAAGMLPIAFLYINQFRKA